MNALSNPGKLPDLLSRDGDSLGRRIIGLIESCNQAVWNVGSRNLLIDEAGIPG